MTAWLGVFAMWLIVFAPVVSQGRVSHDRNAPLATICSIDEQPAAGHHSHGLHLGACGYCDLLAHHVPAPAPALPPLPAAENYGIAQPPASLAFIHRDLFRAGRPRDSPFLV
jgi:hypothetical protein